LLLPWRGKDVDSPTSHSRRKSTAGRALLGTIKGGGGASNEHAVSAHFMYSLPVALWQQLQAHTKDEIWHPSADILRFSGERDFSDKLYNRHVW
jgi:hypothetical protein